MEQGELAGATSGQAAGLVGQVRATKERCLLAMASVAAYARIEQETGYTADWRQTGSVRIATTAPRAAEFRALAVVARSAGLEVEFLTAARLAGLYPMLDTGGRHWRRCGAPPMATASPTAWSPPTPAPRVTGASPLRTHTTVTGLQHRRRQRSAGVRTDRRAGRDRPGD